MRLETRAVLVERHPVRLRETLQRGLHGRVVDTDPVILGLLHLDTFEHHLVQHLPAQLVGRRHRRVLLLQPARDQADTLVEFTARDHVVVDDRDDFVGELRTLRTERLRRGRRGGEQRGGRGKAGHDCRETKGFLHCH